MLEGPVAIVGSRLFAFWPDELNLEMDARDDSQAQPGRIPSRPVAAKRPKAIL